jgi:hypothetical protein
MSLTHLRKLATLRHEEIESLFDYLDETQFWIKDEHARYLRVNRAFHLNYSLASPASRGSSSKTTSVSSRGSASSGASSWWVASTG